MINKVKVIEEFVNESYGRGDTVKPVLDTACIKRPLALIHSHTTTPFDAPGKQTF